MPPYVVTSNIEAREAGVNRLTPQNGAVITYTVIHSLAAALLGLGTGIFVVLSLLERPVWPLMRSPASPRVSDGEARAVHAVLKRVIRMLPPTMMTTMAAVSALLVALVVATGASAGMLGVAGLFFVQLVLIATRLRRDIRGVEEVPSDGDAVRVRSGLATLAILHHRGLLMTGSTLSALLAVPALA